MNRTQDNVPTIDSPPPHEFLGRRTEIVRCRLSDDEHRAKGLELASRMGELDLLRETHKEIRAAQKEAEAEIEDTVQSLRRDVIDQTEERPVECDEIADFGRGLVEILRPDTGEIVRTRKITDEDRQRVIR